MTKRKKRIAAIKDRISWIYFRAEPDNTPEETIKEIEALKAELISLTTNLSTGPNHDYFR